MNNNKDIKQRSYTDSKPNKSEVPSRPSIKNAKPNKSEAPTRPQPTTPTKKK